MPPNPVSSRRSPLVGGERLPDCLQVTSGNVMRLDAFWAARGCRCEPSVRGVQAELARGMRIVGASLIDQSPVIWSLEGDVYQSRFTACC